MLQLQPIGVDAELRRHRSLQGDRDVAEAEGPVTGIDERLGNDADRVREVDDPRSRRRMTSRQLGELEDHGHRPERLREAARAGRLLTDRAELQGEGLVEQARGLSADPELDQDEVGAVNGGARVIGQRQAAFPAEAGEHSLGKPAHDFAALGADIVECELVDRQAVAAVGETVDELGRVRATAADDGDLEAHSALRGIDRLLITL